jgi:hypothetical protein
MHSLLRKLFNPSRFFLYALLAAIPATLPSGPGSSAFAQSATTGAIGGTVTDTAGALLPNTAVTVKSTGTGAVRTVKTNSSGEYRVGDLEPGTYTVVYTADGFQTRQENSVTITVGSVSTLSPQLTVGSVSDKVEVSDETPLMHTQSNDFSSTIDQSTIDNLPINGRRWSNFALLTPGVVSNSDGFGLLSFRGISYLLNNSTVDGADDNQAYFSEARGRTRSAYTVTQGAVQEFQVNTSNYSAEYGRAAGGVINTVTKSGGNQFHGELYFYDRDNSLGGATNPYTVLYNFNPTTGVNATPYKPKDWRKQWGFGVGGPLLHNRLFWFYAYDQSKRNFPGTARTSDPIDLFATSAPLSGKESCTPGPVGKYGAPTFSYSDPNGKNWAPAGTQVTDNLTAGIYPTGQTFQGNFGACALAAGLGLNYQAATAYYNQGLGIMNSFFGQVPRTGDQMINFPKLDWQINDRNHASIQYNRVRWDSPAGVQTQATNDYGRGSFGNDFVKADVTIFRFTTVLSNSVVNSFLAQYGRDMETETAQAPTPNELPLVRSLPAGECSAPNGKLCPALPADVSIGYGYDQAGFDIGTSSILPRYALPDERRTQGKDDVTWSHGKHTTKFGLDYNYVTDFINNLYNGYGSYNEDWAFSFIGDYLNATTGLGSTAPGYSGLNHGMYYSFSQAFGSASGLIATRDYGGYATDDWRITPALTLTLGVRYEYEYVPGNPYPNPAVPQTLNRPDDRNNVGPRLGFAYNIAGNKTVLRGGYGMYYGRIINSNVLQAYQNSGGPGSQVNYTGVYPDNTSNSNSSNVCAPFFGNTFASAAAIANCTTTEGNISYLDSHLQNPQVHEADLSLEQDMSHHFVLSITYMGSFGRELDSSIDTNVVRGTGVRTPFIVNNTPINASGSAGYVTLPHGGLPAPLPNGTTHYVTVYNGNVRINPNYGNILRIASNVNSSYNALAAQLNKRYNNGFSLLSNITWSHALDYNPYIGTGVPTYNVLDPNDLSKEYGNSSLDVRLRGVFAAVYQPQTHFQGWKDYVLGGWRVSPLVQMQTGLPFTAEVSGYPNTTASGFRGIAGTGSSADRIDDLRRNQFHRPNDVTADLRVSKNFYFDVHHVGLDRLRLELLGEVFNVANHQNITGEQVFAYVVPTTTSGPNYLNFQSNFGTYTNSNSNYTYTPRQIQLAARLHF